jgi:predicted metal-dependent hydrolase
VPGETHLHLGRHYRLRVQDGPEHVRLSGAWIIVTVPDGTPEATSAAIFRWRRRRAAERVSARLDEMAEWLRIPSARRPRLVLRTMRTRWASLSRTHILTVNPDLIRAPLPCIDYVLVHELTHLDHPNHSPAFWRLLERRMPDWTTRKQRLERILA